MKCLICGRKIITRGAKKYCSRKCYSVGKLGSVPWNKGMEYSPRMKIRLNMEGLKLGRKKGIKRPGLLINNPMYLEEVKCKVHNNPNVQKAYFKKKHIPKNWKGNDVGYSALHDWVKRKLGKADICSNCKSDKKFNGLTKVINIIEMLMIG